MQFSEIINQNYDHLNETDMLMATYIYQNTHSVINMRTHEFAHACHASKSSAIRFAQKLGFTGFGELRNFLKWQDETKQHKDCISFRNRVLVDASSTLDSIHNMAWDALYEVLYNCSIVYLVATGVCQRNQALELQRLLLLIGKPAQIIPSFSQSNEFKRIVGRLKQEDIVFVLSLSGENKQLDEVMNILSIYKPTIVSITNMNHNELSGRADYNLYANSSRSVVPQDWWLQTAASFFLLIEAFAFGYMDYVRSQS